MCFGLHCIISPLSMYKLAMKLHCMDAAETIKACPLLSILLIVFHVTNDQYPQFETLLYVGASPTFLCMTSHLVDKLGTLVHEKGR